MYYGIPILARVIDMLQYNSTDFNLLAWIKQRTQNQTKLMPVMRKTDGQHMSAASRSTKKMLKYPRFEYNQLVL